MVSLFLYSNQVFNTSQTIPLYHQGYKAHKQKGKKYRKEKKKEEKTKHNRKQNQILILRKTHQVVCLWLVSILTSIFPWPWFDLCGLDKHGAELAVLRGQGLHHVLREHIDTV